MPTLSIKTYLYAALTVLLLSGFIYWSVHERSVEHKKDVAAATQAVARVEKSDAVIETKASTEVQNETLIYKQAVSLPAVGDIGVVCHDTGGDAVPGSVPPAAGGDRTSGHLQADVFDPSGELLTLARSKDAVIRDLQAEVATMRAEMAAAAKAHR